MSADLNRRGFLKGLMAAAGVAAVGLPEQAIAAVPVVEAPVATLPDIARGEIWAAIDGRHCFIGYARQMMMARDVEVIDVGNLWNGPALRYQGMRSAKLSASLCVLSEGLEFLHYLSCGNVPVEFFIGAGDRCVVTMHGVLVAFEAEVSGGLCGTDIEIAATRAPTISMRG